MNFVICICEMRFRNKFYLLMIDWLLYVTPVSPEEVEGCFSVISLVVNPLIDDLFEFICCSVSSVNRI